MFGSCSGFGWSINNRWLTVGRVVTIWVIGVMPWPGLGAHFGSLLGSWAQWILGPLLDYGWTLHAGQTGNLPEWETLLQLQAPNGETLNVSWEFRRAPYLALVSYVALCLGVSAVQSRTRTIQLLAGCLLLPSVSLLRVASMLASQQIAALSLPGWGEATLIIAARVLVLPPGMSYAVPLGLWASLLFVLEPLRFLAFFQGWVPRLDVNKSSTDTEQSGGG